MFRAVLTAVVAFVATLFLAPIGIVAFPFVRDGEVAFQVTRLWARWILAAAGFDIEVEIEDQGRPLPEGPVVFVANHVSALDIPIVFLALPRSFRIVYKRSLLFVPLLGLFLFTGGHIAIERSRAFRARRSLDLAARRIRGGVSLALFPEGTRSGSGRVAGFKRGSFKLAADAGVPVVPVALIGVEDRVRGSRILPGRVRVKIGQAHRPDDAEALARDVENWIQGEVEKGL